MPSRELALGEEESSCTARKPTQDKIKLNEKWPHDIMEKTLELGQKAWVVTWSLFYHLPDCVTWGRSLNLSEPVLTSKAQNQLPCLPYKDVVG